MANGNRLLSVSRTYLVEESDEGGDGDAEQGPRALRPPHEVAVGAQGGREDPVVAPVGLGRKRHGPGRHELIFVVMSFVLVMRSADLAFRLEVSWRTTYYSTLQSGFQDHK